LCLGQQDKPGAGGNDSPEKDFSGTKIIRKETDKGGKDAHLQTPQTDRKRYLGITPGKFRSNRLKEGGKAKKNRTGNIQADQRTSQRNPPPVKDSVDHRISIFGLTVLKENLSALVRRLDYKKDEMHTKKTSNMIKISVKC
jgi:hypothetical protein